MSGFEVKVRALPGWPTPDWMRLRAWLKRGKRDHGLQCVGCKPMTEEQPPTEASGIEGLRKLKEELKP